MPLCVMCVGSVKKTAVASTQRKSVPSSVLELHGYVVLNFHMILFRDYNFARHREKLKIFNITFCIVKVNIYRSQPVWSGKIQRDPGRAGLIAFHCLIRSSQFGERKPSSKIRQTNLLFISLFRISYRLERYKIQHSMSIQHRNFEYFCHSVRGMNRFFLNYSFRTKGMKFLKVTMLHKI